MIGTILLVLACVLFFVAAFGLVAPSPPARFNFIAGGLAVWVLSQLLGPFIK